MELLSAPVLSFYYNCSGHSRVLKLIFFFLKKGAQFKAAKALGKQRDPVIPPAIQEPNHVMIVACLSVHLPGDRTKTEDNETWWRIAACKGKTEGGALRASSGFIVLQVS